MVVDVVPYWIGGNVRGDDEEEELYFYNRAIEKYPYLPNIYESRGRLYEKRGDLDLAEQDFERARRLREAIR